MGNNLVTDFFKKTDKLLWLLTVSAVIYSFLLISSMQRSGDYNMPLYVIAVMLLISALFFAFINPEKPIIKE